MALGIPAQVTVLTDSLGGKAGDHSAYPRWTQSLWHHLWVWGIFDQCHHDSVLESKFIWKPIYALTCNHCNIICQILSWKMLQRYKQQVQNNNKVFLNSAIALKLCSEQKTQSVPHTYSHTGPHRQATVLCFFVIKIKPWKDHLYLSKKAAKEKAKMIPWKAVRSRKDNKIRVSGRRLLETITVLVRPPPHTYPQQHKRAD